MPTHRHLSSALNFGLLGLALAVFVLAAPTALAQTDTPNSDTKSFPETGYRINDDTIWAFFEQYGGPSIFGAPISREFTLQGRSVQIFQNAALQVQADGSVTVMPLASTGLLPYPQLDGLSVPAIDPSLAMVAPKPDQPNYSRRLNEFLGAVVPETWSGQPVQFFSIASQNGVDWLGLPTSAPAADPRNPAFVYQRFQNGVLLYDAGSGTTAPLPLGAYLKAVLTGRDLPPDIATEASGSVLLGLYDPSQPRSVSRPAAFANTDLTDAFTPDSF